ncbi:MAG: SAM-dependent methyltransferase [Brevundimonas sp.]|uniref:class I SAM-dependent methyltransferase n=1 Tax=Brevundimonas sp. TaxID=1871086 RepID=UPI002625489E|nr:SAM-dependent methyltransferase [Brevundimonas sp.]MDI6624555.1 SAM-dependent methyltransferase [Brevundimonas sp.]MDQ7812690.1 SAM-dependent methyltransferase [Brevundimonas sp.]
MTVADYVTRCLHDPQGGYYATRPSIGATGDFITAPMISQMFGELIGLWAVELWERLGAPERVRLVEVGPGDGTLMADALRAARLAPEFLRAVDLILIEPSPPLREAQARMLADSDVHPRWVSSLDRVETDAPVILIANEVLDCLPARQFVKTEDGWAERCVGVTDDGALTFGLKTITGGFKRPAFEVEPGQTVEISEQQAVFGREVAALVKAASGAALLIDYGRSRPEAGDTLQALRRHQKVDPLATPGEADLTQWADFPSVLEAAVHAGADVTGTMGQGEFLGRLGVEARADRLKDGRPDAAPVIDRQLARLTADDQMGTLFKVCAIFSPHSLVVPGFED